MGFPLLVLYFLYRGVRDRRYFHRFKERLGSAPTSFKRTVPGAIWLHAVSVGEIVSSVRLVDELRSANPTIPIYVSTTTLTGREIAEQKLEGKADGIFYSPIDYAFAIRRVLRRICPAVVVILETEIWPQLYREIAGAGCGLLIVNGRISDRALPRYQRFRWLFRAVLSRPDTIYVQSETDRTRYIDIGAPVDKVTVLGNLKFDAAPTQPAPPEAVSQFLTRIQARPIWVAASLMPAADSLDIDETDVVFSAFEELALKYPLQLLIVAPRKPERFQIAADKLRSRGISYVRRSELRADSVVRLPGVLLLDTIGELASIFQLADVVFMGGTLARRGGHNILEPAFAAKPIIIGPHMENFAAVAAEFRAEGAVLEIDGPEGMTAAVESLFSDRSRCIELGRRAEHIADRNRGVTAKAAAAIIAAQDAAVPSWNRRRLMAGPLNLLAAIWTAAGRSKQARDSERARLLPVPVVSIGGISMGGTGKTPCADLIARRIRPENLQPAILTRGYRRRSLADVIVLKAGENAPVWKTGDEAQILLRSGVAHIAIGSDRWTAAQTLLRHLPANLFILDDGFQHRRLQRDMDIVLIDALDPFGGGAVFPKGRLREPLTALNRADVFIITRAQTGRAYRGIRQQLATENPTAPIFTASIAPKGWIHAKTLHERPEVPGNVAAFCGLGNPDSFWATLRTLGIAPVFSWAFSDHHVYKPKDLRRLADHARLHGAKTLLTTQKDAMNLPANFARLIAPLELYWLDIEMQIEGENQFLAAIVSIARASRASQPVSPSQV